MPGNPGSDRIQSCEERPLRGASSQFRPETALSRQFSNSDRRPRGSPNGVVLAEFKSRTPNRTQNFRVQGSLGRAERDLFSGRYRRQPYLSSTSAATSSDWRLPSHTTVFELRPGPEPRASGPSARDRTPSESRSLTPPVSGVGSVISSASVDPAEVEANPSVPGG